MFGVGPFEFVILAVIAVLFLILPAAVIVAIVVWAVKTNSGGKKSRSASPNLTSCPDCHHCVSVHAPSCPKCGRPLAPRHDVS